jgi:hypothetical protein
MILESFCNIDHLKQQADLEVLAADGTFATAAVRARAGVLAAVAAAFVLHRVVVRFPRCSHGGAVQSTVSVVAVSLQAAGERSDAGFGDQELGLQAIEGLVAAPQAVVELVQAGC